MRRVWTFVSVVSLVLATAVGVLWWRSGSQWDELSFLRERRYFALSAGSSIRLGIETRRTNAPKSLTLVQDSFSPTWVLFPAHGAYVPEKSTASFGSAEIGRANVGRGHVEDFTQNIIFFPHGAVIAVLMLLPLTLLVSRLIRRKQLSPAIPFDCMPAETADVVSSEMQMPPAEPELKVEKPGSQSVPEPQPEPAIVESQTTVEPVTSVVHAESPVDGHPVAIELEHAEPELTQTEEPKAQAEAIAEPPAPSASETPIEIPAANSKNSIMAEEQSEPAPPAEMHPASASVVLEEQDHTFIETHAGESEESWRQAVLEIMGSITAQPVPPSWQEFTAGPAVERSGRRFLSVRGAAGSVTPLLYNYADRNTLTRGVIILIRKRGNGRMAHAWVDGEKSVFSASELSGHVTSVSMS